MITVNDRLQHINTPAIQRSYTYVNSLEITKDQVKLHSIINQQHLEQHTLPSATTAVIQISGHLLLEQACMDEMWGRSKQITINIAMQHQQHKVS